MEDEVQKAWLTSACAEELWAVSSNAAALQASLCFSLKGKAAA